MAETSSSENAYISEGIAQGLRTDGRGCTDVRPMEFELGIVPQADGSARLHLGSTDVIVGVKAELSTPTSSDPDCGRLGVTVECSACASPEFRGRGGEDWGIALAKALETSIRGSAASGRGGAHSCGLDLRSLCIVSGKVCWALHVDALVLNDGGGVLAALSAAARAALAVTRIPSVDVAMGEEGDEGEPEVDLGSDQVPLQWQGVPLIVTVGQVGNRSVVDMAAEEEPCASASLSVAVSPDGRICGVSKDGTSGISPDMLQEMLETGQLLGPKLIAALDAYIASSVAALAP